MGTAPAPATTVIRSLADGAPDLPGKSRESDLDQVVLDGAFARKVVGPGR
ncbi:hypothetical protein AB0903_18400 [Streptomyces sp. NPDC048389]